MSTTENRAEDDVLAELGAACRTYDNARAALAKAKEELVLREKALKTQQDVMTTAERSLAEAQTRLRTKARAL